MALEWFCSYIIENYDRLDAIVNNAAQTVRRPPAYYAHLVEAEKMIGYSAHANNDSDEDINDVSTGNCNDIDRSFSNLDDNDSSNNCSSSSSNGSRNHRMKKSLNTILHHQKKFSSSLTHAVESTQLPPSLESIVDSDKVNEVGVLSEKPSVQANIRADSIPQNTILTPSMSSSEMTQIMLTKVLFSPIISLLKLSFF